MNPLWIVDVTFTTGIPVVAATAREAEHIATEVADDYIRDEQPIAAAHRIDKTGLRFYSTENPFGTEDDNYCTCQEYYDRYQEWVQEEARKKELQERQGKLF